MTTPKKGDRVRVILEDVVTAVNGRLIDVGPDWEVNLDRLGSASIEIVEPPEPRWQPGDVVIDAHGDVYRWQTSMGPPSPGTWRDSGSGTTHAPDYPTRPLQLLVRGKKPVTA